MLIDLPQGALIHIYAGEIGKDDSRLDALSQWMKDNRRLFTDKIVLDIGSNVGHFPFLYTELGAKKVIAVEARDKFIRTFEVIKSQYYPNNSITMLQADLRDVDYEKIGHIDVFSIIGIIYHVEGIEEMLGEIIGTTKPEILIVESQLWPTTHKFIEGGNGSDATQSIKEESVLRPDAQTVESLIIGLGYNPIRFQLSDLYKEDSIAADPRGFWLCLNKES